MFKINKQINRLYISNVLSNLSITGAWVAILAARGFSLVEIGFAETIFHITSLIFEIPSGALADVVGRKNMLILANVMAAIGCGVMAMTSGFAGVAIAFVFHALGFNFASGSDEALAYDSLKLVHEEARYEKYASNQLIIYRITSALSTLCAGLALFLGYRIAYLLSVVNHVIAIVVQLGLVEVVHTDEEEKKEKEHRHIVREILTTFSDSFKFLWQHKKASVLMFANALVGAFDILLLFFLQSKLRDAGLSDKWLGFALFFMEMGGIIGAKWILRVKKVKYAVIFTVCTAVVLCGLILEHTQIALVMALGGFLSAAADDALQVRTDAKLHDMFESKMRATLVSIASFVFSIVMIVLSPLAGWVFSIW